jgi:hypothetical protein
MVNLNKDISAMQQDAETRQKEVLEMIEALSDTMSSDGASAVWNSSRFGNTNINCCTDKQNLLRLLQQVGLDYVQ